MGNIVTILIVLAGLVGVFVCLRSLVRNRSAVKWPTTKGRVISSMVKTVGYGNDIRQRPEVIYEYQVGEKTMQSGRVSFTDDYSDAKLTESEINEKVRKYGVGEDITVFFDPKDPRESVLEPKPNLTLYLAMAICLLVISGTLWWRIAVYGQANVTRDQLSNPLGGSQKPADDASQNSTTQP